MATPGERVDVLTPGQQRGGGMTLVQNIAIDARGADQGVEMRMHRALRESERRTVAAVAGLADRGGGFAKTLGRR